MGFRKFGQSDDQRASIDRDEDAVVGRATTASNSPRRWTEKDQEELLKETREK